MFHPPASEVSSHDPSELWSCNNCGNRSRGIEHICKGLDICCSECAVDYLRRFGELITDEVKELLQEVLMKRNETI